MGRTAIPRSWRVEGYACPDCPGEESAPVASTSSAVPPPLSISHPEADSRQGHAMFARRAAVPLHSWLTGTGEGSVRDSSAVTEQLRRSVLPASMPAPAASQSASEPPWRTSTFGGLSPDSEDAPTPALDTSSIRISRSARASWNAAFNDIQDFPDSSSMLPPRLGTPVPTAELTVSPSHPVSSSEAILASQEETQLHQRSVDEALTTIGRRALARHRLSMLEAADSRSPVSNLVQSLNLETLERAQLAVEGSRIALEQARLAIRVALRNSETRLGRLADLIRTQLQNETTDPLPPLPRSSEVIDVEAERSEYNLERSLANLRAASLEIDRVLAVSQISTSRVSGDSSRPLPTASAFPSLGGIGSATSALSFPNLSQGDLPDPNARQRYLRSTQSPTASESVLNPMADSGIRQPMPRRPIRYLRGSQIPSVTGLRSRINAQDSNSRSSRPQRSGSNRSLAVQVSLVGYANDSTSNLARNVLTNIAQRSSTSDEEVVVLSDEEDRVESTRPTGRPAGARQPGRWIRLDANGDEILGENDRSRAPLGWSWATASHITTTEDEKPLSTAVHSTASIQSSDHGLLATSTNEGAFNDLVGR